MAVSWSQKLRKASETISIQFCVRIRISYFLFELIIYIYLSCYLQNKHLYPRFILLILLNTNGEDHQIV